MNSYFFRSNEEILPCVSSQNHRLPLHLPRWSLQGIAAGIGISIFLRASFMISLKFLIIRTNEVNTTLSSGIVELWFLDRPLLLLFAFRCIGHMFPHLCPQSVWPGSRLLSCQSLPDHIYHVSICFFQQYIQWCSRNPGHVEILQWDRKWFFSLGTYSLTSGFHVMTVNKIAWNGPEGLKKTRLILLQDCLVLLVGLWSRIKVDVLSSWSPRTNFIRPSATGNMNYPFLVKYYFLCVESFCVDFRCVHLLQFLNVCNQYVTLPNSPRVQSVSEEQPR